MLRFFVFTLLFFTVIFQLSASHDWVDSTGKSATIVLNEVQISTVSGKFQIGSKEQILDSSQMRTAEAGNIGQALARYAPIYIKSDAGGISSIRIRGTSSNQTSVLFGGFDINSMTLGSSNLSNIPVFLFDQISLQYGSSSAENGSGSIGGSIRLGLNNEWMDGIHAEVLALGGSFGEYTGGFKVTLGNSHFKSSTRYYNYYKVNDFSFENTFNYDYNTQSYTRAIQRFSAVHNQGFLQELAYRFSAHEWIKAVAWLEKDWHQQQPTMFENDATNLQPKILEEKNQRLWLTYNNNKQVVRFHFGAGYAHDQMIDSGVDSNSIRTQRWISEAEVEQNFWKNASYKAGVKYRYIIPNVYAYPEDIREQQLDIYASVYKMISPKLSSTFNIRKQFVTHFNAPLTPSLGMSYLLKREVYSSWKLLGNISRSYRIPTLNDRYWQQSNSTGNNQLQPEEGINYEGGIKYTYNNGFVLHAQAQYFYMDIKNWLLWIQGASGVVPKNVQRVVSQGIEFQSDMQYSFQDFTLKGGCNATYNSAIRKESINSTDMLNQQLEYSPQWMGTAFFDLSYHTVGVTADVSYTGKRYYDQLNQLPAYTLLNAGGYVQFKLRNNQIRLSLNVQNILNTSYQNQYSYAMPEINYQFNIKYIFN